MLMQQAATAPKLTDAELLQALRKSPVAEAATAQHAVQIAAERKQLDQALADLDRRAGVELPKLRAEQDRAVVELKAARARVTELEAKINASTIAAASFEFDNRRAAIEAKLKASASPLIGVFLEEMRDEAEQLQRTPVTTDSTLVRNAITGRSQGSTRSNIVAIVVRIHAVRCARAAAEEMHLLADQSEIVGKLAALRATLPGINEMSAPPRHGSAALLRDLMAGVAVKDAIKEHCGI